MTGFETSGEPEDPERYTREWDRAYTTWATAYDVAVRRLPVWKTWIGRAVPHIVGPRVLEVSFGTGYLLTRYAADFETHGIDYNHEMVRIARANLERARVSARLVRASVDALPYRSEWFDSLVNTMSFSGYPDGARALGEMRRVLRVGGRLILIDVSLPPDRSWKGSMVARLWERSGDILRDMPALFRAHGFEATDESIGAWGSVRLYVATKMPQRPRSSEAEEGSHEAAAN